MRYYGITRETVDQFRKTCYICNLNTKKTSQDRLKPIVSTSIFERVQIDLVDMRNCPDGECNWIAHMEDHNGQYHCLWPQKKRRQIFKFSYVINKLIHLCLVERCLNLIIMNSFLN